MLATFNIQCARKFLNKCDRVMRTRNSSDILTKICQGYNLFFQIDEKFKSYYTRLVRGGLA